MQQLLQPKRIFPRQAQLLREQIQGVPLPLQAGPDHAGPHRHLALQPFQDAQLAQLVTAVQQLLDPLLGPAAPQRLPAHAVPQGIQLAGDAALDGDLPQLLRGRAQLGRDLGFGAAVLRPQGPDQVPLPQGELALEARRAQAREQGSGSAGGQAPRRVLPPPWRAAAARRCHARCGTPCGGCRAPRAPRRAPRAGFPRSGRRGVRRGGRRRGPATPGPVRSSRAWTLARGSGIAAAGQHAAAVWLRRPGLRGRRVPFGARNSRKAPGRRQFEGRCRAPDRPRRTGSGGSWADRAAGVAGVSPRRVRVWTGLRGSPFRPRRPYNRGRARPVVRPRWRDPGASGRRTFTKTPPQVNRNTCADPALSPMLAGAMRRFPLRLKIAGFAAGLILLATGLVALFAVILPWRAKLKAQERIASSLVKTALPLGIDLRADGAHF